MQSIFDILIHWIHVSSAVTLLGGTIMLLVAVLPAENGLPDEAREAFKRQLRKKTTFLTHLSLGLLFTTGIYNIGRRGAIGEPYYYYVIFLVKFLFACGVLMLAGALTLSMDSMKKFQERRAHWMGITILLGLVIVLLSAWLRMIPPEIK